MYDFTRVTEITAIIGIIIMLIGFGFMMYYSITDAIDDYKRWKKHKEWDKSMEEIRRKIEEERKNNK